jgi:YHS domain-containing protein
MMVDVMSAKYKSDHNRSNIYFCCAGCKQSLERQPEKYALCPVKLRSCQMPAYQA